MRGKYRLDSKQARLQALYPHYRVSSFRKTLMLLLQSPAKVEDPDPTAMKKSHTQIPDDVVEQILLKLPSKTLTKLKIVSKQWLRLITSDSFAFRWYQVQNFDRSVFSIHHFLPYFYCTNFITPVSFCQGKDSPRVLPLIDLPHLDKGLWPFPIGYGMYGVSKYVNGELLLWNPTTKETKALPQSPYFPSYNARISEFGMVEYEDGNFYYNIGRITSGKIKSITSYERCHLSLELYSSKTKSWKFIPNFSYAEYLGFPNYIFRFANLNGRVHWVIPSIKEDTYITAFDVFRKFRVPSPLKVDDSYDMENCFVTLFDDKFLCLLCLRWRGHDDGYLDIWVMREYGVEEYWTKQVTVKHIPEDAEVLGFSSKLQGVFFLFKERYSSPIYLLFCDCKTSSFKGSRVVGKFLDRYKQMVEHQECFASLSI